MLRDQELRDFEVVVVVDGDDGETAAALRALELPFPLRVLEQRHQGAAAARNAGAAAARGRFLLFLDDDMAPDRALLAEHDRSHRGGAGVVLGHLPLDPASPPTAVAAAVGRWAERRRARLADSAGAVPVPELITGQMSLSRDAFAQLGGFDVAFTRGGLVPGADRDFGYRARRSGLQIVFNPRAISHQYYEVDAEDYTRRSRDGARGDRILAARYPEIADELWQPQFDTRYGKLLLEPFVHLPRAATAPLRSLAVRLFSRPDPGRLSHRFFFAVQTMERRRGAVEERRTLRAPIAAVLAVSDLERLVRRLDHLLERGWMFVGVDELLDAVSGRTTLPPRSILLTFDDADGDLLGDVVPMLVERRIPAVVFALADPIALDRDRLRSAAEHGVVVGSHGTTRRPLVDLPGDQLDSELVGSADTIESLGLPRPSVFSYPRGEWSPAVAAAVQRAGYRAAFTVVADGVRRLQDRYALPRLEIRSNDGADAVDRKLEKLGLRRRT